MLSRLPKAGIFLRSLDNLDERDVTQENLESLLRIWPAEEFDELLREARENPDQKWEKTETYFITLGRKKKFELRLKLWLFKQKFDQKI